MPRPITNTSKRAEQKREYMRRKRNGELRPTSNPAPLVRVFQQWKTQ